MRKYDSLEPRFRANPRVVLIGESPHARRRGRPPRPRPRVGLLPLVALGLAGCAPTHHVGRLLPDGTYVNRGFGVVLPLEGLLAAGWEAVDPQLAPDDAQAPQLVTERVDLDGDGMLRLDETIVRVAPALLLRSRTATATRIRLEIEIASEPEGDPAPLRGLFDARVKALAQDAEAARRALMDAETVELALERPARVAPIEPARGGGAIRLALVDQRGLDRPEGPPRRQLLWLRLDAPTLTPSVVTAHQSLLERLIAAREVGRGARTDRW